MRTKRLTALILVLTVIFSLAVPAFAGNDNPKGFEKFSDMKGYGWASNDAGNAINKGIFVGLGYKIFAPGAKITQQEAAVSAIRLIEKDDEANALSSAAVDSLLNSIPDKGDIASWAKPSVAMLVQLGHIKNNENFYPLDRATRLDIAVLLVKVLGYEAIALTSMDQPLSFNDAKFIPADKVGYVYVAVDKKLITGYGDSTFRPNQAVKRIEAAVMMGRADYLLEKLKDDNKQEDQEDIMVSGSISALAAATGTTPAKITINSTEYQLTSDAIIKIDNAAAAFASLVVGDTAVLKISEGLVTNVDVTRISTTVSGSITQLTAATPTSLAEIAFGGTKYLTAATALFTINGNSAQFADLRAGDQAALTIANGLVTNAIITRTITTASGTITQLTAATTDSPAIIRIGTTDYTLASGAIIKLNSVVVLFAALQVNDGVTLTIGSGLVDLVEATR